MEISRITYGLFLIFLLDAARQDLWGKQVKVWTFVIFAAAASALDGYRWIQPGSGFSWWKCLAGCLPGVGMLALGKLWGGEIGAGDGLFFLVSGLMLEPEENLAVLCGGVFLCGMWSMAVFCGNLWKGNRRAGKATLPFLPFAAVPGIWISLSRIL